MEMGGRGGVFNTRMTPRKERVRYWGSYWDRGVPNIGEGALKLCVLTPLPRGWGLEGSRYGMVGLGGIKLIEIPSEG